MREHTSSNDAQLAGIITRPQIAEYANAPAFVLDCELIGPDSNDREEYFYLVAEAERISQAGNTSSAKLVYGEAKKLLNTQWHEVVHNTVTVAGKNDVINQYFKGAAYTASWYLGLLGTGTISVNDVISSHAGWTELTPYSGSRPSITWGTSASGSNTASQISFTINASATIAGAFIVNNSTAGGTSGTLYSAADFTSARTVASGDTLNVTPTITFS